MEIYTYEYFIKQATQTNLIQYFIFIFLLAILLLVILQHFKSKKKMKYRDLIMILSLAIVFFVGIQVNEYQIGKDTKNNSTRMINLIDNISTSQNKAPSKIAINSKYVKDEMLVKIDDSYFLVNMNADLSAFTIEETYLLNAQDVRIVEE